MTLIRSRTDLEALSINNIDTTGRLQCSTVRLGNTELDIINIHAPSDVAGRDTLLSQTMELMTPHTTLIGGDFNWMSLKQNPVHKDISVLSQTYGGDINSHESKRSVELTLGVQQPE